MRKSVEGLGERRERERKRKRVVAAGGELLRCPVVVFELVGRPAVRVLAQKKGGQSGAAGRSVSRCQTFCPAGFRHRHNTDEGERQDSLD